MLGRGAPAPHQQNQTRALTLAQPAKLDLALPAIAGAHTMLPLLLLEVPPLLLGLRGACCSTLLQPRTAGDMCCGARLLSVLPWAGTVPGCLQLTQPAVRCPHWRRMLLIFAFPHPFQAAAKSPILPASQERLAAAGCLLAATLGGAAQLFLLPHAAKLMAAVCATHGRSAYSSAAFPAPAATAPAAAVAQRPDWIPIGTTLHAPSAAPLQPLPALSRLPLPANGPPFPDLLPFQPAACCQSCSCALVTPLLLKGATDGARSTPLRGCYQTGAATNGGCTAALLHALQTHALTQQGTPHSSQLPIPRTFPQHPAPTDLRAGDPQVPQVALQLRVGGLQVKQGLRAGRKTE